jgi:hypothetical protein
MKSVRRMHVGGIVGVSLILIPLLAFGQLSNGGFESWSGDPLMPDDWTDDIYLDVFQENTTVYELSYSCRAYFFHDSQAKCDLVHDTISVVPGQSYNFSAWVFDNDDAGRCRPAVWWVPAGSVYGTIYSVDSTDWQQLDIDVTAPAGVTQAIPLVRFYDVAINWDGDATIYVDAADWQETTVPIDTVTIYDIQYTTDPSGDSPYAGSIVHTYGIVSGVTAPTSTVKGFFLEERPGGAWHGVFVYTGAEPTVSRGDSIEISGEVDEYYDCTEIKNIVTLNTFASGVIPPGPTVLTTDEAEQEMYEGVLVRCNRAICTDPDLGYGEWRIDGLVVDDLCYVGFTPDSLRRYDVTGPNNYAYGTFRLCPRDLSDIVEYPMSITDIFWAPYGPEINDPVSVECKINLFVGGTVQNDVLYYYTTAWNTAARDSTAGGYYYYTFPGYGSETDVDFYIYAEDGVVRNSDYSDTFDFHIWADLPAVKINEVYYDPDTSEAPEPYTEWVELYNPTGSDIDVGGYVFSDDPSPCNTGAEMDTCFTIPGGTVVPASGYLVLAYDADSFAAYWGGSCTVVAYGGTSPNLRLGNDGDDVHLLYNGNDVDNMWYGHGGDMGDLGHAAAGVPGGHSTMRIPDGNDTDVPANDWFDSDSSTTGSPTPCEPNGGYLCGDTNDDGILTTGDGFNLLNWFGSTGTIPDPRTADVNGINGITTGDGYELLNWFGSTGNLCCHAANPGCSNCDPSPPCP